MKGSLYLKKKVLADPINSVYNSYSQGVTSEREPVTWKRGSSQPVYTPLLLQTLCRTWKWWWWDDDCGNQKKSSLILAEVEENNPKRPCQQLISLKKQAEWKCCWEYDDLAVSNDSITTSRPWRLLLLYFLSFLHNKSNKDSLFFLSRSPLRSLLFFFFFIIIYIPRSTAEDAGRMSFFLHKGGPPLHNIVIIVRPQHLVLQPRRCSRKTAHCFPDGPTPWFNNICLVSIFKSYMKMYYNESVYYAHIPPWKNYNLRKNSFHPPHILHPFLTEGVIRDLRSFITMIITILMFYPPLSSIINQCFAFSRVTFQSRLLFIISDKSLFDLYLRNEGAVRIKQKCKNLIIKKISESISRGELDVKVFWQSNRIATIY